MEAIYTPQGDGNQSLRLDPLDHSETIYTPQGDGNNHQSLFHF